LCPADPVSKEHICTPAGQDELDKTKGIAAGSTVAFSIGAAAIVAGVVLILTAPSDAAEPVTEASTRLIPVVGPSGAGLTLTGTF